MFIVKKYQPDKILRRVSSEEKNALHWVLGKGEGSDGQKQLTKTLLQWIRDREAWLQCDCQTQIKPLMTVALTQTGKLHIRRMNLRGEHSDDCLYKNIDSADASSSATHRAKIWDKSQAIQFHRSSRLDEEVGKSQSSASENSRTSRDPKFARVLYAWLEEAKLRKKSTSVA